MSFPDSFWVAAGAAAPVIALAAVVSLSDIAKAQFTVDDATISALGIANGDTTDKLYRMFNKRGNRLAVLRVAQLLNLCFEAALLAISLLSLEFQRNLIPVWICVVALTAGVLLLAYAGLTVTGQQEVTSRQQQNLANIQKVQELERQLNLPGSGSTTGAGSQPGS